MTSNILKGGVLAGAVCVAIALGGCSRNEWQVKGTIEGADSGTLVLEASNNGLWYPLDTAKLSSNGSFSMRHAAAGYPDIYRLRMDDRTIYFPIDSLETVTVTTTAANYEGDAHLSGSASADLMNSVESVLRRSSGGGSLRVDSVAKRELAQIILSDPAGVVAYYIINKSIDGKPLFNPADRADLRVIGAVANAYDLYRPNDARTRFLKSLFISNRIPGTAMAGDTVVASEVRLFDIDLYDNTGAHKSLVEVADANKVVLLSFTLYNVDASPAYNVELNKLYEQWHNRGLEIYQVAFDDNEYQWRESANNLPWVTVYNSSVDGPNSLVQYNVQQLPTLFVISNGELVDRIDDITKAQSIIARYL